MGVVGEVDERILHKVRLLLNKTMNNPNEHEVESALLMAQRIMAEHGITQIDVSDVKPSDKHAVHHGTELRKLMWWEHMLSTIIADNFKCFVYIKTYKGKGRRIMFLGLEDDVKLALMVYDFALESMLNGSKLYVRMYKNKQKFGEVPLNIKNDYIDGWLAGIKAKFEEQVNKEGWGLVLVKDGLVIQAHEEMKIRKGRTFSVKSSDAKDEARASGYQDGKSFSSDQKLHLDA